MEADNTSHFCKYSSKAIQIWKDNVKHVKVCAKCHHEGNCLRGIELDCDDFKPCDRSEDDCKSCEK